MTREEVYHPKAPVTADARAAAWCSRAGWWMAGAGPADPAGSVAPRDGI